VGSTKILFIITQQKGKVTTGWGYCLPWVQPFIPSPIPSHPAYINENNGCDPRSLATAEAFQVTLTCFH